MLRSAQKSALLLSVLVVLAPAVPPEASRAPKVPDKLPHKETLEYTVEWRLITAGKARLTWNASPQSDDPGWQANLHLESTGLISKFFKVNNNYASSLQAGLCALSSHMVAHEGRRHRETSVTFDPQAKKATYLEKDLTKNAVVISNEIDIPSCVHDVVGGLYLLRTLHLEPGQNVQVPISDGKKSVMVRVEAQHREQVKTPKSGYKTIQYEVFLFNNVLYRRPGHVYVWLTDDERKLPVQIQVRLRFTVGTITLRLENEQTT